MIQKTNRFWIFVFAFSIATTACDTDDNAAIGDDDSSTPIGDAGAIPNDSGRVDEDSGGIGEDAGRDSASEQDPLLEGETDFVSADGVQGEQSGDLNQSADAGTEAAADDSPITSSRTVEEGDIYRVLGDDIILNLNAYRGLQVIDFSDVSKPEIIGRYPVTGSPVEMYVVEDRVYVLLNNWSGYYGARDDVAVYRQEGGLLLSVDISDRTAPKLIDQEFVQGNIRTSRLTRGGDQAALYVAASYYGEFEDDEGVLTWDSRTVVQSFDVSDGTIAKRTVVDLGGYVSDIQATTEALLVARYNWNRSDERSSVTIVDISNPDGTMVEGDEVLVQGMVNNKFNMDLYGGILRIVSGSSWNLPRVNHVQTYNASDYSNLVEIDDCAFGENEDLYATLFLQNKAFFVTYFRTDPFHAFWIDDEGNCEERSEFVVSGWNDYFRPVFDQQRLIGIGKNDENSRRTMAVSLYDITDLSNSDPLLDREDVDIDSSWSEASWDDRAFSVLEDALGEDVAGGETGLVLLPFQGYNHQDRTNIAAVQIFTFSETTLTRRGVMDHGSSVRRSFLGNPQTTVNLSESEMSLFDHTSPDSPRELGRLELAPNYTQILTFGDYAVRLKSNDDYYYWDYQMVLPNALAQVVSLSDNPDTAEAVASIEVPANAYLIKADAFLVVVDTRAQDDPSGDGPIYKSTIDIYDMNDPTSPASAGKIETDRLRPNYGGYYYDDVVMEMDMCFDCFGYYGSSVQNASAIEGAVVFFSIERQSKLLGTEEYCYERPVDRGCWYDEQQSCTEYHTGSITCRSLNGGNEICTGDIVKCELGSDDDWDCAPVDNIADIETQINCHTQDSYRYWGAYTLHVLDLTGANPKLTDPIEMPRDDEGVGIIAGDNSVYYSYKIPVDRKDDPRPVARYFFKQIDLRTPSDPEIGDPINIPGELLQVQGSNIYTQDLIWGKSVAETVINKLEVNDGLAYRRASFLFSDRMVDAVVLDGTEKVLVSHRPTWQAYRYSDEDSMSNLTILDTDNLEELSTIEVDRWATLNGAQNGRALFEVPGGLLVVNLFDPTNPFPQAYFPTRGWPQEILFEDNSVLFAAGRYGIYQFEADTFNLLSPDDTD